LELSITDALIVKQHLDVFRLNGFKVQHIEDQKFILKSLPASKKVTFTTDDFHELIEIVNENLDQDTSKDDLFKDKMIHKEVLRPKKIYNMLASRACRSSIMIGRSLDLKLM